MQSVSDERRRIGCVHHQPVHFEQPCATWRPSTSTESSDEKGRQREAARRSHKDRSCMNSRRRASMDMAMDLEKHGRNLLPGLRAALARPSASSSHRRTCRPRRRNRLRLPKPRCGGDCQHRALSSTHSPRHTNASVWLPRLRDPNVRSPRCGSETNHATERGNRTYRTPRQNHWYGTACPIRNPRQAAGGGLGARRWQ